VFDEPETHKIEGRRLTRTEGAFSTVAVQPSLDRVCLLFFRSSDVRLIQGKWQLYG
jgi:hypothetical protein